MESHRFPSDLRPYYPEFLILLGRERNRELLARVEGRRETASDGSSTLLEISEAIARLRAGTFGLCEECAAPIPLERLRRVPYTRTCIACQAWPAQGSRPGRP